MRIISWVGEGAAEEGNVNLWDQSYGSVRGSHGPGRDLAKGLANLSRTRPARQGPPVASPPRPETASREPVCLHPFFLGVLEAQLMK